MATFAARRLQEMAENAANIVAIELLAAVQGLDFANHFTLQTSWNKPGNLYASIAPFYDHDRYFAPDIQVTTETSAKGSVFGVCGGIDAGDVMPRRRNFWNTVFRDHILRKRHFRLMTIAALTTAMTTGIESKTARKMCKPVTELIQTERRIIKNTLKRCDDNS